MTAGKVENMELKRTSLYECHKKCNGRFIDFGGWEMPVQYEGVIKEHRMVREKSGLFDVSHMGEIKITGERADVFLDHLLTNDIKSMLDLQVQYNLMCYPDGGTVDDLLVYKYNRQDYLLVVNAVNTVKNTDWINEQAVSYPGVTAQEVSADYIQLAVQGPLAESVLQKITAADLRQIKFFSFQPRLLIGGVEALVSRTGYTGEDGFEIYLPPADAPRVWEAILQAGAGDIAPIGLGARDTLRFEAKLPLYGQEITADISPIEAGLGFFVKLNKGDFIGRDSLQRLKDDDNSRRQVEFIMLDRGVPRAHYQVTDKGELIGEVTTGAFSPTFSRNMGLAVLQRKYVAPGTEIDIMIRGKPHKAQVGKGLFYSKKTKPK